MLQKGYENEVGDEIRNEEIRGIKAVSPRNQGISNNGIVLIVEDTD